MSENQGNTYALLKPRVLCHSWGVAHSLEERKTDLAGGLRKQRAVFPGFPNIWVGAVAVLGFRAHSWDCDLGAAERTWAERQEMGWSTEGQCGRERRNGKGWQGGEAQHPWPQDPGDGATHGHVEGISASLPRFHDHFHGENPILNTACCNSSPLVFEFWSMTKLRDQAYGDNWQHHHKAIQRTSEHVQTFHSQMSY